jgi:hypothetical protein
MGFPRKMTLACASRAIASALRFMRRNIVANVLRARASARLSAVWSFSMMASERRYNGSALSNRFSCR